MRTENINSYSSRKNNNVIPKAAVATLLFLMPCEIRAEQDKSFLEKQPKTDTYETSAKDIIDLKADGSYTVVDTNKTEKTEIVGSGNGSEKTSDKKGEKGGVSLFSYLFLMANYIIMSGLWIKALHDKRNKDKIIEELYNGNKKIYEVAAENIEKAKETIDFLVEKTAVLEIKNRELRNENTRLKYLTFNK